MKRRCTLAVGLLVAMLIVSLAGVVSAGIPEPDVIFYGNAWERDNGNSEPATEEITLVLSSVNKLLASYTPDENDAYGEKYVLRVPMDALDSIEGQAAKFFIGTELAGVITIPAKGSVVEMNIDTRFEKDSDEDGMDDDWELMYFGNLDRDEKGDINGDGETDLLEFQNGTDPTEVIWEEADDGYWETCVAHAIMIQKALAESEADEQHNRIKLQRGTYAGNFQYTAEDGENFDLEMAGGYASGCNELHANPVTVLNGDLDKDNVADGIVLALDTAAAADSGAMRVFNLEIKNGLAASGAGGGIRMTTGTGGVEVIGCTVSDSQADSGGGIGVETDTGAVYLANNLLVGNTADTGGGMWVSTNTGSVTIINNTLNGNAAAGDKDAGGIYLSSSSEAAPPVVLNNIIANCIEGKGVVVQTPVRPIADYNALWNNPKGNFDPENLQGVHDLLSDPDFENSAGGDFRLKSDSPCRDAGQTADFLPAQDRDGKPRLLDGDGDGILRVDIGAFEYGDGIPAGCNPQTDLDCDGIGDAQDLCTGFDDAVDTDNDSAPDGCDLCPGSDDYQDSDGDAVPDGCDQCEGFDDAVDVDQDGVPDGCDELVDSDKDGIADAQDQCPGHKDGIDSDGDSVPDGCDRWPGGNDLVFADEDGDGMPQDWEETYGLDQQNDDADDDPDGDLFTNLQEYLAGTNPKDPGSRPQNNAPGVPALNYPSDDSETDTLATMLSVSNATDADGHALHYSFELYADKGLTSLVAIGTDIAAGENTTNWQVDTTLQDNTDYYWRARAFDGIDYSAWMTTAEFFINTANDEPLKPVVSSPEDDAEVSDRQPTLEVTNAVDFDKDRLTYEFEVYADRQMNTRLALKPGVAEGDADTTSWQVNLKLDDDTPYWWRVQARDDENATSGWTDLSAFFVSTMNDVPTAPLISDPSPGDKLTTLLPSLAVFNATDSDLDVLIYLFEIDTVQTFDSVALEQSDDIEEGTGSTTAWQPPELAENTTYHWRVRAFDGAAYSDWSNGWFLVNLQNEAPETVTVKNPGNGSEVTTLTPVLQVHPATDPDQDPVTFDYEVYADAGLNDVVASIQGAGTVWLVDAILTDNTAYYWQVRAVDEQGAAGPWSTAASFFVNTANERPEAPALNNPVSGGTVTHLTPTLSVSNSPDRDLDDLIYEFELYTDQNLFTKLAAAEVPQGELITAWTVDVILTDDTTYYWRVRANDGVLESSWMPTAMFTVRTTGQETTSVVAAAREMSADSQARQTVEVTDEDNPLNGVQVEVPPGALTEDCTITISQVINPPALPANTKAIGKVIELGPSGTTFLSELIIMIPYTQADLDAAGVSNPAELEVYTYDTSTMTWELIPVAGVDITRKNLLCRTDHFSMFTTAQSTPDTGGGGGGCFIDSAGTTGKGAVGVVVLLVVLSGGVLMKRSLKR